MNAKSTKKSISVILDAMIIIEVHELGIWKHLLNKIKVLVPSTVVRDEALYFDTKKRKNRSAIHLVQSVKSHEIIELAANVEELQNLQGILDYATLGGLHAGETEALALMISGRAETESALFCTADGAAIRALALLGKREYGISLEALLHKVGLQKPLDQHFKEGFFRKHLDRGSQDRVTGIGLKE